MPEFVFVDIETSDSDARRARIVEIAATYGRNDFIRRFHSYLWPDTDIDRYSTQLHGISKGNRGRLYQYGRPIPLRYTMEQRQGLDEFLRYIRASDVQPVYLVTHGEYNCKVIASCLYRENLHRDARENLVGFVDSLVLARVHYDIEEGYSMDGMIRAFLEEQHINRSCRADASSLKEIVDLMARHKNMSMSEFCLSITPKSINRVMRGN